MPGSFAEDRYRFMPQALRPAPAQLACEYALTLARDPQAYQPEPEFKARGRYADALGEALLINLQGLVEKVAGCALLPCYSYLRIYQRGAVLPRHLDRPSCEISTTLTLGFNADAPWPIGVERDGVPASVVLGVGDMLVYKGAQVVHWRERFEGEWWVQVFLHYVAAAGPYAEFRYDGRERLGPFDAARDAKRKLLPPIPQAADPCPCLSGQPYGACHGAKP